MSSDKEPSKSPRDMLGAAQSSVSDFMNSEKEFSKEVETSLRAGIKSSVDSVNSLLASVEESSRPLFKSFKSVEEEGNKLAHQVAHFYSVRHEYGPHIIASSVVLGGLMGLRRGRLPAVAIGSVTGFFAYLGTYQVDLRDLPEVAFGKK